MNSSILRKYFIMGSQDCKRDPEEILREAIGAGITAFQYREKGYGSLQGDAKVKLGKNFVKFAQTSKFLFLLMMIAN